MVQRTVAILVLACILAAMTAGTQATEADALLEAWTEAYVDQEEWTTWEGTAVPPEEGCIPPDEALRIAVEAALTLGLETAESFAAFGPVEIIFHPAQDTGSGMPEWFINIHGPADDAEALLNFLVNAESGSIRYIQRGSRG